MSKKTEQSQSHSDLPSEDEFRKMSLEEQEEVMETHYKNQEKAEQDTENSEESEEVSEEEETEEIDDQESSEEEALEEEEEDSESESTDNQESDSADGKGDAQQLLKKIEALESKLNEEIRGRKALQADYTKKATELKQLKEKKEQVKKTTQSDAEFDKIIGEIEAKDPEIAKIFRLQHEATLAKAREEAEAKFNELQDSLNKQETEKNLANFSAQVEEAMKGKYKDLEEQFNQVTDELYPTDEELQTAAATNPNLFSELEKEVRARYPREVIAVEDKLNTPPVNRDKAIKKAKGIKKTKTSKKTQKDLSNMDEWNKLSLEEQEKELEKQGRWSKY